MINFTISLEEFNGIKKGLVYDLPVDRITAVYDLNPIDLGTNRIPLCQVICNYETGRRMYTMKENIRNIKSKIMNAFREWCQNNPTDGLSTEDLPAFDLSVDTKQHARVLLPLNRIRRFETYKRGLAIAIIDGEKFYLDESQSDVNTHRIWEEQQCMSIARQFFNPDDFTLDGYKNPPC